VGALSVSSSAASQAESATSDGGTDSTKDAPKENIGGISPPPSQTETEGVPVPVQGLGGPSEDADKRKRALEEEPLGERGDEDELISGKLMKGKIIAALN
jgi:hypothetical protein